MNHHVDIGDLSCGHNVSQKSDEILAIGFVIKLIEMIDRR